MSPTKWRALVWIRHPKSEPSPYVYSRPIQTIPVESGRRVRNETIRRGVRFLEVPLQGDELGVNGQV